MPGYLRFARNRRRRYVPRRRGRVAAAASALAVVTVLAGCTGASNPDTTDRQAPPGSTSTSPTRSAAGTGLIPPDSGPGPGPSPSGNGRPTVPASAPPIVTSTWLTGASTDDGIVIHRDDDTLWYGRQPGEHAVIGESGYQWFGADGSIIGCAASGSCVGVDADGHVVVTKKPKGVRTLYTADGRFVAVYSAGGDRDTDASVADTTIAKLIETTGVDLGSLVNAASLAAPFAGGATGDPHLITADGVRLTTQAQGQFVARGGDKNHRIQLQFDPMLHRTDVSIVGAVAIATTSTRLVVTADGAVTVDGTRHAAVDQFAQINLPDGVTVGRWPADTDAPAAVVVAWPDGGSVTMTINPALGITVVARLLPATGAVGLFGTRSAAGASSDLLGRGNKKQSVDAAVDSWRVTGDERLFDEPPANDTAPPTTPPPIDAGAKKVATQTCRAGDLAEPADLAACVFDVGLTGDPGFVIGHSQLADSVENPPVASSFAANWPALETSSQDGKGTFPSDGRMDFGVKAHASLAFPITVEHAGTMTFIHRSGCAEGESPPGPDQSAMRVFDARGNAVSDRLALCGHEATNELVPGSYRLVVSNARSAKALAVRMDVSVP